jgi:hypothetical protein
MIPEGPDDPVGIGIFFGADFGHALTVWSDGPNGLGVTDSDDGIDGIVYYPWVSATEINYQGTVATVGYASFMADVPEPSTLALIGPALVGLMMFIVKRRRTV